MKKLILGIILIVVLIVGVIVSINWSKDKTTIQCKEKFGNEWSGRYVRYGPNLCVSPEGAVKIP